MTLVMDGVRRTTVLPMPSVRPKPRPQGARRPAGAVQYVMGVDGIRRPVALAAAPREVLARLRDEPAETLLPVMGASELLRPLGGAVAAWAEPTPVWRLPSLRLPAVEWRQPALAFGLVAAAVMVASLGLHALITPRTTADYHDTARTVSTAPMKPVQAAAVVTKPSGLQNLIETFAQSNGGTWGIVVKNLKTGETASYQPDRQFASASLYKLFVAQRIYQRVDIGQLSYGQDAGGGSGRNIDQCLTIMINISDNTCGRALGSILGWGAQNQALSQEGYAQTDLATPQKTSAADVARLYDRLYNGTLLSPASTQRFLGLLKDQRVNNRLPQGLPAGTTIAHKTGDLDGVTHDAGIVFGPKTDYIVVVTSGPWGSPAGVAPLFGDLSSRLWHYFED